MIQWKRQLRVKAGGLSVRILLLTGIVVVLLINLIVPSVCLAVLGHPPATVDTSTLEISLPATVETLRKFKRSAGNETTAENIRIGRALVRDAPLPLAKAAGRILIKLGQKQEQWLLVQAVAGDMLSRTRGQDRREWLWWQACAREFNDRQASLSIYLELLISSNRDEYLFRLLERFAAVDNWKLTPEQRNLVASRALSIGKARLALTWLSQGEGPPVDKQGFELWLKASLRARRPPVEVLEAIRKTRTGNKNLAGFNATMDEIMFIRRSGKLQEARTRYNALLKEQNSIWKRGEIYWALLSLERKLSGLRIYRKNIERYLEAGLSASFKEKLLWRLYNHVRATGVDRAMISILSRLVETYPDSRQHGRAMFLLGKILVDVVCQEETEERHATHQRGVEILRILARDYSRTLYGLLADRLLLFRGFSLEKSRKKELTAESLASFENDERFQKITQQTVTDMDIISSQGLLPRELVELLPDDLWQPVRCLYWMKRFDEAFLTFSCLSSEHKLENKAAEAFLATAAGYRAKTTAVEFGATKPSNISEKLRDRFRYPVVWTNTLASVASEYAVDPFLVLAVIREESHFNPTLVSSATACGIMQIIPSTGRYIAKKIKLEQFTTTDLFDPAVNIRMGTWYLGHLLATFKGDLIAALAAYNGGPGNVKRWKAAAVTTNPGDFLELIDYDETRNYVQKVVTSYLQYLHVYFGSTTTQEQHD